MDIKSNEIHCRNIYDHDIICKYFSAREADAHYQSIKKAKDRRDYSLELIEKIKEYVKMENGIEDLVILTKLVFNHTDKIKNKIYNDLDIQRLLNISPQAYELLNIHSKITLHELNENYKNIFSKNEYGIKKEDKNIQEINEIYVMCHEILCVKKSRSFCIFSKNNCKKNPILYSTYLQILSLYILIDIWDVYNAYSIFRDLRERCVLRSHIPFYFYYSINFLPINQLTLTILLCKRLLACDMNYEAKIVYEYTLKIIYNEKYGPEKIHI